MFVSPYPKYTSGFENINEVIEDAKSKDELAQPESYLDYRRPSWKSYQNKIQKSFISQKIENISIMFGLKSRPYWHPSYFKYLLEKSIENKEELSKNEYVVRIIPKPNSKFIIWGDLAGAYHSVVRGLQKLIELNLIDENLGLKNPDDFIVFLGDANSRSPFIMELLTLIMKLEERNKDKTFYLAGNNERDGSWQSYGLLEEIRTKEKYLNSNISIYEKVEQYFQTIPLAVYISIHPHISNNFVRISHFALETPSHKKYESFVKKLDYSYYSKELLENRNNNELKIIKLKSDNTEPEEELINVDAIIKSTYKLNQYAKHNGLQLLTPEKEATAWTVMSCPTVFWQKLLNFYNDTFVILETAEELDDWTITLYYRDIRTNEDFKTKKYDFISGQQLE